MNWEDLQNEPTLDLIEFIKHKVNSDYKELAESAFVAFTFRFRKDIIDKCRKVGKKWGYDRETCDLMAERTFERFWKYPFNFEASKCDKLELETCVKLYLFRIARNCFFDYNKEISGDNEGPYDGSESIVVELPSIENLEYSERDENRLRKIHDMFEQVFSTLTRKHKIIYLTYKAYEKEGYKLPRTLLKKLRDELQLSQSSIRVYKNEAFQKIDQHLKLHRNE